MKTFKKPNTTVTETINKSQMLADMHPDVAKVVWRYGRWHHYVDYLPFKKNMLKLKDGITLPTETNNYGLKLKTYNSVSEFETDQNIQTK